MGWQDAPVVEEGGSQPAWAAAPLAQDNPQTSNASVLDRIRRNIANLAAGGVRGAGSIGATLVDAARGMGAAAVNATPPGMRPAGAEQVLQAPRGAELRAGIDGGLQELGADPKSLAYQGGKLAAEIAGTAGVGSALGTAAQASGMAAPVVEALASGGLKAGGATGASGAALRAGAGAMSGGATAAMVDPEHTVSGAVAGAALPLAVQGLGAAGNAVNKVVHGPAVPAQVVDAAQVARDAGYVIPPTTVRPTLVNRVAEGTAGKLTLAQEASARNQKITNNLARRALGLPDDVQITPEVLDAVRAEAGKAYGAVAGLGKIDAAGAKLPAGVNVRDGTDMLTLTRRSEVDAADLVNSWRQANHDATAWYRSYERTADPDSLTKARQASAAAKQIDEFLTARLQAMGKSDMVKALKDARVLIAKTHNVERALNAASGNVNAATIAKDLQAGKPLTGELQQIGKFAAQFPKVVQTPERMGALPGTSPLDWWAGGAAAAGTGNPLALAGVALRPATRAALLSKPVQDRAVTSAASAMNPADPLLSDPTSEALQILFARGVPAAAAQR